jgi:TM2 domain-containing membrane protein YozV
MRGHVLGVDKRTGDGIVSADDGRRYSFTPADWAHRGEPAIGMYVDFDTDQNRALALFPVPGAQPPSPALAAGASADRDADDRNKYVAAFLAFILGPIGIHRFYLGRIGSGIVMLILTVTVVGLLVSVPWALIDLVRYLCMSDREFARRYARDD